jgi:cell shape-determining protein MreD
MPDIIVFLLILIYGGGIWKFWRGFDRTNFQRTFTNRLMLTLLWPALFITNKSYRQNFRKTLKG